MSKSHQYNTHIRWTGNTGNGTENYRAYERAYTVSVNGKTEIAGSSDPVFRGDPAKHNPEEMLVAALSACHMLSFLHLCSASGVVVVAYSDTATGTMEEAQDGNGRFTEVVLKPDVIVKEASMIEKVNALHEKAHQYCFIANSCNFPVLHQATCVVEG
ncbi:MAG: OsmC family protein [Bacteroidota bacterium]|nr:OsmC family protein [Bacteroidota bacterium]